LKNIKTNLRKSEVFFDIDTKIAKIEELEALALDPNFWSDTKKAQETTKETKKLQADTDTYKELEASIDDLEALFELSVEESDDESIKECDDLSVKIKKLIADIEFKKMLSGQNDKCSAILDINSGAGGTEAQDWAEMLSRMYSRWAETKGFKLSIMDRLPGDEAGVKNVTLGIEGEWAYGYLQAEIGVHRLVRISPFDSNKRRHTSFASVFVYPQLEDDASDFDVNESEIRVDTYRASGAGGQHVNTTDSAVRMTHVPTGITASCQSDRSQHKNRSQCMKILKAKLYDQQLKEKQKETDALEQSKGSIAWGSQIRSYVMQPYQMVKDHRTNFEIGNVESVLDGSIDKFIEAYLLAK
jgi:peptide chain release factor 2